MQELGEDGGGDFGGELEQGGASSGERSDAEQSEAFAES